MKGKDPDELFIQDCVLKGCEQDRCLLYVYRLAVYFAESETHDAEKLNWWYWKDRE